MRVIKVAVLPVELQGHPSDMEHPERVLINFEAADDGGPLTPMKFDIWSEATLSFPEIEELHRKLCEGAVVGRLATRAKFAMLRHLSS